jgi:hypothetical protein
MDRRKCCSESGKEADMKIFPIGTSRLHEPLTLRPREQMCFPGFGYVHSSSQVVDLLRLIRGDVRLDMARRRWFFRKDQTEGNRFDTGVWAEDFGPTLARVQARFDEADLLVIEICSPRSYRLGDVHLQGNPNAERNAPYDEVWKTGYYARYVPELGVEVYDDLGQVASNLATIDAMLADCGKSAVVLGHLVDPAQPNVQRVRNNEGLREALASLASPRLAFMETDAVVQRHGFRVLENGKIDIHHLPWSAFGDWNAALDAVLLSLCAETAA